MTNAIVVAVVALSLSLSLVVSLLTTVQLNCFSIVSIFVFA